MRERLLDLFSIHSRIEHGTRSNETGAEKFSFYFASNLRGSSFEEKRRFNIAIAQLAHRGGALSLMQFVRVIIKQTPLSLLRTVPMSAPLAEKLPHKR